MNESVRAFGLKAEKGRWIYILIGFIINLCLGSVYSWSVFRKPLEELFSVGATQSGLPYLLLLALVGIVLAITLLKPPRRQDD